MSITLEELHGAHNYHPLPVVLTHGEGAWVTDVSGRRLLDLLAGYSALNFGHRHPRLVEAAKRQLDRLTLTSRAFHSDQLGEFCAELAALAGKEAVLPMNTGAEAVETGVKLARRWGYRIKGVPADTARVIVFDGNFHGRTTTIVSFSTDPVAREDYGPYTPGFDVVKYGDLDALRAAVTPETVAVLLEPVQGEAGVVVPPDGWLRGVRELCDEHGMLMVADEIQSGLARTGRTFACDHEDVVPDVYLLGKALGGGILPLSAVVADRAVMDVFTPGSHGSTFGGNPLAAAVGREVVAMLSTGEWQERATELGAHLDTALRGLGNRHIAEVRTRGPWAGVTLTADAPDARVICERMAAYGVLCKEAHGDTLRLAPPLVVTPEELTWAVDMLGKALG
ncbi:ornithine--oxo-acid transaminase [Phytomonospora sp. NPDC050363]|uniref:ornithine--oxo-acid transaminase n=1 Tax=Phytomonospora sp. NPDC050363 TaxID=3155642 RepID=UPI003408897A